MEEREGETMKIKDKMNEQINMNYTDRVRQRIIFHSSKYFCEHKVKSIT